MHHFDAEAGVCAPILKKYIFWLSYGKVIYGMTIRLLLCYPLLKIKSARHVLLLLIVVD
jgi:hypothetical protein